MRSEVNVSLLLAIFTTSRGGHAASSYIAVLGGKLLGRGRNISDLVCLCSSDQLDFFGDNGMKKILLACISGLLMTTASWAAETNLAKIVAVQEARIQALTKELETRIKPELEACKNANNKASWAEGRLCFLSNGACPAGFTKQTGYLEALRIYQNNDAAGAYLSPATFGDSSISWHGGTPYRYDEYAGNLHLSTCCR